MTPQSGSHVFVDRGVSVVTNSLRFNFSSETQTKGEQHAETR